MPNKDPLPGSPSVTLQSRSHLQDGPTYLFASPPATPKDKPADILVRFQAVGRDHPAVDSKSIFISSRCTLLETRRILHKFFSATYDRGFIFLRNSKEVLRHNERALRLIDVMPHLPLGLPAEFFRFPDVQYKKLSIEKGGQRVVSWFAGIIFLCEKSTHERWQGQQLRKELCADRIEGFSFLPANIMSAKSSVVDTRVDTMCELAAMGKKKLLVKALENIPEDVATEAFRDHVLATPLHYAASNGQMGVAEVLLGRLGNEILHVQDLVGRTPLHRAIYSNKLDMISYLLHLGPDLKVKDRLGNSCLRLMTSLYDGSIEYLMSRIEPYVLDSTLLLHFVYIAFQTKHIPMCRKLCEYVHPVKAHLYRPFLHQAAEMGDADIVQTLLQQRREPRVVYDEDYGDNVSILSEETYRRTSDVRDSQNYAENESQQHQIKSNGKRTETDTKNKDNEQIEAKKAQKKKKPIQFDIISDLDVILDEVGELVHRPDVRDTDGHLPLHYACQHGKDDVINLLYYDEMENKDFVKGIKLALSWRRFSTVQCLTSVRTEFVLDPGTLTVAVKAIDHDLAERGRFLFPLLRQSPLILTRFVAQAAATNDTDVLTLLFNMNVPLLCQDLMGRTPLHEACQHGKEAAMRFLMLHGADPSARDWRGSTPFHYACAAGKLDIVCVMAHRENVNVASLDACQRTPLLVAAQRKQFDVVLYLVVEHAQRADLLRPDVHGDSILHHLADFEPDLFNIVLEAAVKVKDMPLSNQKAYWSYQHCLDNAVIEAWTLPSAQPTNPVDVRADSKRTRTSIRATKFMCLKCSKTFTTLRKDGRAYNMTGQIGEQSSTMPSDLTRQYDKEGSPLSLSIRWSHLCSSPLALGLPQIKPRKRPKVTTSIKKPSSKDSNDSSHFQRSVVKFPSQPGVQAPKGASTPIDFLMILGRNDLIPTVLAAFPPYRRVARTALLAARMSNVQVLTAMHKAEGFSKDAFTHLLHVTLVRISRDSEESKDFLKFVKFLLKSGASPNYIPVRGKFDTQMLSPSEVKLIPYMPLEIAAMTNNEKLVDLLLEFEASASIAFAVHLAAIKGHLSILKKLLPHWKEGRWKPYIKGFKEDPNELVRVCTLESGLVQAVCASQKPSMELLECIKEDEKGVYSCKKILTHHMVNQLRPDICSMSTPSLMNKVLYKHAEDVKGDEHICQHLFLTNLLLCKQKFVSVSEVDTLASFLVDNDCYLGEIRVSKKSTIHVVCESFIVGVGRKMWKTVESILIKGGNTLWKCLLVTNHTCHKFAYSQWMESSSIPCLSKGMWDVIHAMPLNLLEIFLEIGKRVINRHDMKAIKEKITIDEEENVTTTMSKDAGKTSRQENMLRDVILYHVRNMTVKAKGKLLMLSKLTTLLPDIFPITLESIRFSPLQCNWFTAAGIDPVFKSLHRGSSTSNLIKQLRLERLEIRLWNLITGLSVKDVMGVQERDLSLLHVACLQNDFRLVSACMAVVVSLSPNMPDSTGVTPMDIAASRGNLKILETLKGKGGVNGPSVLVAACVGKGFMVGLSSAAAAKKKDSSTLQSTKSTILDWLFTNFRDKLNLAYKHADHGTMFDVMLLRHAWSLLDWTLDNAGTDTCCAVMIRSTHLSNIAYAPADLVKKIAVEHQAIIEKMPITTLKEIFLRLSAFPQSSMSEFLLKKALTLKRLIDQDTTVSVLGYRGKHGEGLLHNACRTGNTGLVKTVITTLSKSVTSPKQIREIIDTPDKSGCTPLWYSLAFRSWKIAEYLIVNGAQAPMKRAVPGLWNKRLFEELSLKADTTKVPSQRSLLAQTQLKRADSINMAELICPASPLFKKLYGDTHTSGKAVVTESIPLKEPPRSKTSRGGLAPTTSKRKPAQRVEVLRTVSFVQDDMESVGNLASPRTPRTPRTPHSPRTARTLLPESAEDTQVVMSPRVSYPDETDDDQATKLGIQKRKRVRYLLSLVDFTRFNKGTLVHAACTYGNSLLLKGILASPLVSVHREDRSTFSPLIYSIINNCPESTFFCIKNELGPYEKDPLTEVLSIIIMKKYGFDPSHKTLKRLLNRFTIAKETIRGIKLMLLPMTESMKKLRLHGTLLTTVGRKYSYDDETIGMLIQLAIKHNKGEVHNRLLMAIAATGRHFLLSAVLGIVTDEMKQTEIFKRKVVHNATLLDLVFILSPTRLVYDVPKPEFSERMKIIGLISHVIRLDILPRTLSAAVKKNILPMLEMIVQDFTRNNVSLQSPELWYEAIFKAASTGDISFINTICVTEMNTKTATVQAAMLKALCLACQRKHRAVANRLLLFKMPLHVRVEGVPGRYAPYPRLALDCAIEGGDAVIASLVLQTMEETGMYPSKQDMLQCISMAFDKGMEPIVDNLLQFAHYSSPSLVTLRICHWLYLSAARRGNGMVCSKFLDLPDFKVGASDDYGFTAMHYASMHGKSRLIKQIAQRDSEAINARTPNGWSPLDIARAFGRINLAMDMITSFGAMQGTGFDMIVTQGWLKRSLETNAVNGQNNTLLMAPAGNKSRGMSVVDLLRQGNDVAARCLLEVAQESVVACLLFDYANYPLIHLCARTGCFMTLEIILQLISAQPKLDLREYLQIELKGKIPLCVAIENCNIECVDVLVNAFNPVQWRYKATGESLLHFAAKCSNEEIINLMTQEADFNSLQVQDKDGLIPATTSIALGKHSTAKYFLNGLRFAEKLHHDHTTTAYWCVLCLLDCCIGWSKIFLENAEVSLNGKGRNIFQRHVTESGFSIKANRGKKAVKSHPLNSIHSWRTGGATQDVMTSALAAMQYSQNGFKSELFLLLSRMTRFEALEELIKKGKTEVACYLYEKLCPSLDRAAKVWHFINASAHGRLDLVKKILELNGDEICKVKYKGEYSAMDVAIGFGHKGLADVISHAFDSQSKVTSLHFLKQMESCLPQEVRWNLGMSRIGDKEWKDSIDYDSNRLSLVDLFLLKKPSKNSFPQTLLPRDIMPSSFKGKIVEVNHLSMQTAITQIGVDDTWLTSLLLSKSVLGRYYGDIVEESQSWKGVDKIVLHCVTSSSEKSARTELQLPELHDTIQVEKTTNSQGETTFQILTAPFPIELTPFYGLKDRIQDKIIPIVKRKIKKELYGLDIDVVIDWNSIETLHDVRHKQQIMLALEGKDDTPGPLAGMNLAIDLCGGMLRDIEAFYNRETVQNMVQVLESVTEIQVKYLRTLPKAKDHILIPNDGRMSWTFAMDNGRPKYNTALFPLGVLTQMFHTVAVCLHHGVRTFTNDNSIERHRQVSRRRSKSKRFKPNPITLIVQWKSFMFLNRLKTLTQYLDTAVAPQIQLIGAQYMGMLRLKLAIHTIVLSNVPNEDDSRMTFSDGVLNIRLHSFALTHKPWTVTDIDASKVFNALEVDFLSKKWRTGSVNVTASRHRATNDLLTHIGFPIDLPMAGQNVLEMLCRLDSRVMTHPYDLLKQFSSALYKHISQGYIDSVITKLSFSSQSWLVGPCKSPPGIYSWIRLKEAMDIALAPQFLAYVITHEKTKRIFLQLTKQQLQKLPPNRIIGLWYKISTHNIYETLRHTCIGHAQLIVMKGKAFLVTQPAFVESFLASLPEAVSVGFMSSSSRTRCITFDEAFSKPLDLFAGGEVKGTPHQRSPVSVTAESYEFQSWQLGISRGFNVVFETQELTGPSTYDMTENNQRLDLSQSFYISYATYTTLCDVTDISLYEKPVRDVMKSVFKHIGIISIGPSIPFKCVDLIHGEEFEESADVYLVSDRDLHILPMGTMWQGDTAGVPFAQTLLVALCAIFLQQTKTRVSHVLAQSLSRAIHPSDIKFKSRVKSAAEVSSLSTTKKSVKSLENSINRILAMTSVGTRKLKMDLTGVEFTERRSGPMVTFDSGVLKCQLFKEASKVDQKVMDRDFFFAVDEEGGRRMMEDEQWGDSQDGRHRRQKYDGLDDLYSVTSSEVYTVHQEGSVLEKQRIPKHHSDDSHVVQLAIKRLFSGVEIGRTSDIVDSLDIGANVNSLNDNGETPLIVAARSRNYTTIDLLLTRGAATQMADVLGVTALHYEAGHGDSEAVKLMLSYGADPNAQDQFGRTPLHYAVVGWHQETVDLLVFCGADASIMNKDGESPKSLSQNKATRTSLHETDLLIRGMKTGNVAIEHLMLQAETIYKMAATGLTIRTPSGMGLSKTSLMVRRVVPEYSLYGPQPGDLELLMSDVYDFRISGAYVEEPLLIQIPIYKRVEQHEDIFVKTDNNVYSSPIKVGRVLASNKLQTPQFMCHVRLCLHGVRSIILVVRPRAEKFQVSPSGLDFSSVIDPLVKLQFRQDSVQEECDVTVQVTSKPSYEEEDYDSILSMSHFYDISSSSSFPLKNEIIVTLPLPENYLGHGVLHVLMRQQETRHDKDSSNKWLEILRNPDYARDVVKLPVPTFGQLCLLERAQQPMDDPSGEGASIQVATMTTNLFNKTRRREYSACFLAMAKPRHGGKSLKDAEVVVECILSSSIHARLQHWKSQGFVDLKPSHTREFCTVPKQCFLIVSSGPCEQTGITMPPLQFHPKRNNCVKFLVQKRQATHPNQGCVDIFLRGAMADSPRSIKSQQLSFSMDSLQTDGTKNRATEDKLASIPIFLQWTAEPGDTRGQDCQEKLNLSPFDSAVIKADIRGAESPLPSEMPDSAVNSKPDNITLEQVPPKLEVQEPVKKKTEEASAVTTRPGSGSKKQIPEKKVDADSKKQSSSVRQMGKLRASATGRYIRKISPVRKVSMPSDEADYTDTSSSSGQLTPTPQGDGGVLDWLAEDLGDDWFITGVLLCVPYSSLQEWNREDRFSVRQKAMKMLQQWKQTRSFRPDHGVPELFMTLQRLGKTEVLKSLKEKMKVWINENLEKRGCLKATVNKSLLEDTESLEPMSPLFLLALARKLGFSIDLMYDLGLSRPEVSRVMTDTFLRHREDKMLGLFVMFRDKSLSPDQAMQKLLCVLKQYNHVEARNWMLATSRQWLMNHGSADDQFAHAVGQILHDELMSQSLKS